jgi:hypothetical protein
MKIKSILVALSLFLAGTSVFAGNGERTLRKQLNQKIKYPELQGEKVETAVLVQFTIQEDGSIHIDSISSENAEVNDAIAKQLQELHVSPQDTDVIGKTFNYRIVLKVQ